MAKLKLRVTVVNAVSIKDNGINLTFHGTYSRAWKSQRKVLDSPECEAAYEAFSNKLGHACCLCHYKFEFIDDSGCLVQSVDVPMSGYDHAGAYDPSVREAAEKLEFTIYNC